MSISPVRQKRRMVRSLSLLAILLVWVLGCTDLPPAPEPTPSPTPLLEPITLLYPKSIQLGQTFSVGVQNNSEQRYAFDVPDGDNCLFPKQSETIVYTEIPDTCDVMTIIIVPAGEKQTYTRWDLNICAEPSCLSRKPAPTGAYSFEIRLFPVDASGERIDGSIIEKRIEFVIAGTAAP